MARYDGPVVDAHHHLWSDAPAKYPWLAAEPALACPFMADDYFAAAAPNDVVATVWIEACASDPLAEAKAAAALHAAEPRLATAIIAHAPLDASDLPERLDRLQDAAQTLRGIRDIVAVRPGHSSFARHPDLLQRPAFAAGLRELARRGLSFDLMLEPWQMDGALALAAAIPDLPFIIEHAGSPDFSTTEGTALWRDAMRRASALPNIAVKISALHCRMPGWTNAALAEPILSLVEWFGVDRLTFASDFPVHDRTVPFADAYQTFRAAVADLSADGQRALFHQTARNLYRL
ncbi:hydrolase [Kaistia algarum]|uniref:amidohydrolase family protein n=1 Tax=Kaistia algarum TaxID=2083279 RepID=UPI000CE7721C|nr:amidohydrolase family protein [Kaistia algarum]MCX5513056.1 amidohydrolase family protein [Kaistia algarum]PPE81466.1 hydrolase [Kaistia algarum]